MSAIDIRSHDQRAHDAFFRPSRIRPRALVLRTRDAWSRYEYHYCGYRLARRFLVNAPHKREDHTAVRDRAPHDQSPPVLADRWRSAWCISAVASVVPSHSGGLVIQETRSARVCPRAAADGQGARHRLSSFSRPSSHQCPNLSSDSQPSAWAEWIGMFSHLGSMSERVALAAFACLAPSPELPEPGDACRNSAHTGRMPVARGRMAREVRGTWAGPP